MTELWFRNPHNYVRELVECGGPFRVAWDRGMLVKKRLDPFQHGNLYFGENEDWEALLIGEQGTAHIDSTHPVTNPLAVYPTWSYDEEFAILEEMVSHPIGENVEACTDESLPKDERPVLGQPHRVVLINLPNVQIVTNRPFYRRLAELQEEYPECIMIIHGSYSYRVMFGMGFGGADVECRQDAAQGRVRLPNGKVLAFARTINQQQWVNLMGMSVVDLKVPRNRCIFNIKAARWAAEHFTEDVNFKSRGKAEVDPDSPTTTLAVSSSPVISHTVKPQEGDKITCDTCSLADHCKYYREGAVCSVPGSETSPLAKAFQSRDSGKIIDGLGTILAAQTNRLERGMESEEEFGELDPEVTKLMNQLFANGVKLAKLVDPTLTKPLVQINGSGTALAQANPREMAAAVVRALEQQGVAREDITPEMFEMMMRQMVGQAPPPPPAIPATVVCQDD